MIEIAKF